LRFQLKVTLPVLVLAAALMAALFLWWGPRNLSRAQTIELLEILLPALALMLAAIWFVSGYFARRPLRVLAGAQGAAQHSPELGELAQELANLRERLQQTQAEASQTSLQLDAARKGLHESQERYVRAVSGAGDGMWDWDIGSGTMTLSPRWKAMLGLAESEAGDTIETWKARIHPDDRAQVEAALQAHIDGITPRFESEHRMWHHDGTPRWVLSRGSAIRHASGKAYRVAGLDTDITQQRRMEEALQHVAEGTSGVTGEAFFRSLVRHFAEALDVQVAFVTECLDQPPTRVRTLAHWRRGKLAEEMEYALRGTPCEGVVGRNEVRQYPSGVAHLFPEDAAIVGLESYFGVPITDSNQQVLGHLAFLDDKERSESGTLTSIYRIFAARAGAELRRRRVQQVVTDLATRLASRRGQDCFESLVENFCKVVGTREAIVTQCLEDSVKRLRVLAWWRDGRLEANVEYDLAGTTCEETINEGRICVYRAGVGERFPPAKPFGRESYLGVPCFDSGGKVIGHIACFDSRPLDAELPDRAILEMFAQRAGLELERQRVWQSLHALSERVSSLRGDEFFSELARSLAIALGVREAFITECMNYPTTRVHKLAHWKNQLPMTLNEFDLAGTPCEEVIGTGKELYCPRGVGERWPRDKALGWEGYIGIACRDRDGRVIGHIALVDDKPMTANQPEWSVLKLIAERAAIEMERRQLAALTPESKQILQQG
jgi:PAS domain S-box-containing protein